MQFPHLFSHSIYSQWRFKNDLLRVPPQNKNKLINLRIYNRWGQLVYYSTKKKKDGMALLMACFNQLVPIFIF
jgi:hypothetical protein